MYEKIAKLYSGDVDSMNGGIMKVLPFKRYKTISSGQRISNIENRAKEFLSSIVKDRDQNSVNDIFYQKLSLTQDRTYLIVNDILEKEALHKQNLTRLYDDLLMIDNWRIQRPFPQNYSKDKTWMDFNKMELGIRDQIRREIKDSIRSVSFNEKDLRDSLLDCKKQFQKNQMMAGMLEDTVNDNQGGEYSTYNIEGDLYRI